METFWPHWDVFESRRLAGRCRRASFLEDSPDAPSAVMMAQAERSELPRSAARAEFAADVGIRRRSGRCFRVRIFDLSPQGCKTEFVERPEVGERVWVKFDDLHAVEATVRWVVGHVGGLKFERPIHPAVFNRLIG